MKRVLLSLTEAQDSRLRQEAERRHVSIAALVREAVDCTFPDDAERRRAAHLRSLGAIGRFRDTANDVSERHDDYLAARERW